MTSDRRLIFARPHVADAALRDTVAAETYVTPWEASIASPVVDLCPSPEARRDRQLIYGDAVRVIEQGHDHAFVQARKDGYVGYVAAGALSDPQTPTHFVATPGTHMYETESLKSADLMPLTFGARVCVTAERHKMFETPGGYIPKKHLRPMDRPLSDPATAAQLLFGAPYLWGGNSRAGIDCSGLIQAALLACARPCPGDSDLQAATLGQPLADGTPPERGDLYFWQGHVGILVDPDTLLHANAHHMAVVYEPIAQAILRIQAQGDGPVIARKRLPGG